MPIMKRTAAPSFITIDDDCDDVLEIVTPGPSGTTFIASAKPDIRQNCSRISTFRSEELHQYPLSSSVQEEEFDFVEISDRSSTATLSSERTPDIILPFTIIQQLVHNGLCLRPNKTVELIDGDFLQIKSIVKNNETGEAKLTGHRLQRTKSLNGMLEKLTNEVAVCFEVDLDDPREPSEQAIVQIQLSEILRLRNLRCTNFQHPTHRNLDPKQFASKEQLLREGGLTLRWKYTSYFATAQDRLQNKYKERSIEYIRLHEVSAPQYGIYDEVRRFDWRGETVPGGASVPDVTQRLTGSALANEVVDLTIGEDTRSIRSKRRNSCHLVPEKQRKRARTIVTNNVLKRGSSSAVKPPAVQTERQKYTYGDGFCGTGGTTRGAFMAGLKIKYGFDFNPEACANWRRNFPYATCYQQDSHTFFRIAVRAADRGNPDLMKVDILHLSPPCQCFSPAHTREGKDDDINSASLFAVQSAIIAAKPRIVTLEQTFGINHAKSRPYFHALIQMFTSLGYSIRWSFVSLAQWGLPQRRKRLIMIASCPGESLPRIPLATHSDDPNTTTTTTTNLKPFVSVAAALASIPRNAANHDLSSVLYPPNRRSQPYDANAILPRCMTTSGGDNYHPSGTRGFTLREYATLQGFPAEHVFKGTATSIKKQIGNAVPPCVARVLFESIVRELKKVDGIVDVVELDD